MRSWYPQSRIPYVTWFLNFSASCEHLYGRVIPCTLSSIVCGCSASRRPYHVHSAKKIGRVCGPCWSQGQVCGVHGIAVTQSSSTQGLFLPGARNVAFVVITLNNGCSNELQKDNRAVLLLCLLLNEWRYNTTYCFESPKEPHLFPW